MIQLHVRPWFLFCMLIVPTVIVAIGRGLERASTVFMGVTLGLMLYEATYHWFNKDDTTEKVDQG